VRILEAARNHILQGPIASYERFGFGLFLVELTEGRVPLGICGLIKRDILPDVDIGYAFLPQFRAQGYAFEAAAAVLVYGRDKFGLKRVVAATLPDNVGSVKLLQKLGLKFEQMFTWSDGSEVQLFGLELTPSPT
jgi:RimJ/RimL family protein N-acetyltransferase